MSKLLRGDELIARCEALGIDTMGEPQPINETRMRHGATTAEMQQRLMAYERSLRESRMWIMALLSALASLASAVVAVLAVVSKLS